MKLSELIATLQREQDEHGDVDVLYTWESITREVDGSVYFSPHHAILFLDADENHYKAPEDCTHSGPPGAYAPGGPSGG